MKHERTVKEIQDELFAEQKRIKSYSQVSSIEESALRIKMLCNLLKEKGVLYNG